MKKNTPKPMVARSVVPAGLALTGLLLLNLAVGRAHAVNGTAFHLDFNGPTAGFGTSVGAPSIADTSSIWSTSSAGTVDTTARTNGTQITIGATGTDFAGETFSILLGATGGGVVINSTDVDVTFTGSGNASALVANPQTWTVPAGSSLTVDYNYAIFSGTVRAMNWNNRTVTFQGGGTLNFPTPFGANSSTAIQTQNMPGGTINLQMQPIVTNSTYRGSFVLTNGTLNFASAGSANAFNGFTNSKSFSLNGGIIDNTSGSPMTLSIGTGVYSVGGNFTFTGSSDLGFGTNAVVLTGNRTVTVSANTLTIDGPISGSGFGLTKAGAGMLLLTGTNTYTGATTVTDGTLAGAGAASSACIVRDGATLSPGSGIGTFNCAGITFSNAATLEVEIDSTAVTADKIISTAPVSLGSATASFSGLGSDLVAPDTKFVILDYTGTTLTGNFAGRAEGSIVAVGADAYTLSYIDSSRVTLTALGLTNGNGIAGQDSATALAYSAEVSTTDLINAGQPTLSSATVSATHSPSFPGSGINNGGYSDTSADNAFFAVADPAEFPATATYDLDVSANTLGYEITAIKSFMGWAAASQVQANQTYGIEVRTVGSASYTPLATVSYKPFPDTDAAAYETLVTVARTNAVLATGVDSIRFTFTDPIGPDGVPESTGTGKGTMIREIDVIGYPVAPPPGDVAISSPSSRSLFQRSAANTGSIPVSGTYTGSPDRIEARVVVMPGPGNSGTTTDWQTIEANPTGGSFSGTLTDVPAGGWYQLEVRSVRGTTQSAAAVLEKVGVGDIYVTAGQSNSANYGNPAYAPADDRVSTRTSVTDPTWRHGYDPQPVATGTAGSVWSRLGDLLATAEDVPIGFVCVGVGSTQVASWIPGTANYNNLLKPAIQSLGPAGFRAVLWHQGESDAIANTTATTYASRLNSMIAQSRTDAGWDVPWYVAEVSFHSATTLAQEEPVVAGQRLAIYGDAGVFLGPSTDPFHLEDAAGGKLFGSVHFNAAGLADHAAQWRDILRGTATATPRNGDFEDNRNAAITGLAPLADGTSHGVDISSDLDSPSVLGWRILSANGDTAADGTNGFHNPAAGTYAGAADTLNGGVLTGMSGRHVAFLDGGAAGNHFLHTTRAMAQSNANHTLTVAIGVRDDPGAFGGVRLDILARGQTVATATFDKAALDALRGGNSAGAFTDVSLNYQTGEAVTANQSLAIRIAKVGGPGTVLDFDNVRFTVAPTGYSEFQNLYWGGTSIPAAAQAVDPDGDGNPNGIEYFLGTNPTNANPAFQFTLVENSGDRWVRCAIPLDPAVTDAGLGFQYSFDLASWNAAATAGDGSVVSTRLPASWELDVDPDIHPHCFFRLYFGQIVPASP